MSKSTLKLLPALMVAIITALVLPSGIRRGDQHELIFTKINV